MADSKPEWAAHIWIGCDLFAWLRLVAHGRAAFGVKQLHLAPLATALAAGHTFLRYAHQARFGERIRQTPIAPPVFILGHWRTGTTLLHELLIRDPRHTFPDTCDCLDPNHPLLTAWFIKKYFRWLLPSRRQMDNMSVGWERPQEDEFALALLGARSPYNTLAFPKRGPFDAEALVLDGLPRWAKAAWKRLFLRFVRTLAYRDPRRLVLKSPPHTCRIPTLLELFPDARFVYLVRDPFVVYPSTVNLWKKLHRQQGLCSPGDNWVEEHVLDTFVHFHRRYEATKSLIPGGRLHEMKYEELTRDPVGEVARMYSALELGDFEQARPNVETYLKETATYEKNRWSLSDAERKRIGERWGEVIAAWGYEA